jgi:hypothetical protein
MNFAGSERLTRMRCLTNARWNTSASAMSQLGQPLPVRQDRTRVSSTPNNCRSHCPATNFRVGANSRLMQCSMMRQRIEGAEDAKCDIRRGALLKRHSVGGLGKQGARPKSPSVTSAQRRTRGCSAKHSNQGITMANKSAPPRGSSECFSAIRRRPRKRESRRETGAHPTFRHPRRVMPA